MTRVLHRTVPLLLLATLLLSANPVRSGGRDVPETQSSGSGTTSSWPEPPLSCGEETTLIWLNGVPYALSTGDDGTLQLKPSLSAVWDQLFDAAWSLGFGDDGETSCP